MCIYFYFWVPKSILTHSLDILRNLGAPKNRGPRQMSTLLMGKDVKCHNKARDPVKKWAPKLKYILIFLDIKRKVPCFYALLLCLLVFMLKVA